MMHKLGNLSTNVTYSVTVNQVLRLYVDCHLTAFPVSTSSFHSAY